MNKLSKSEDGFSVIETILIILVIGLLGVVGYLVQIRVKAPPHHMQTSSVTKQTSAAPKAADPYAGWKTGHLQYERLSFKYPSNWTLADTSGSGSGTKGPCGIPGYDQVTLTSPSQAGILLQVAGICGGGSAGLGNGIQNSSVPVRTMGQDDYIAFFTSGDPTVADNSELACLVDTPVDSHGMYGIIYGKNVSGPNGGKVFDNFCYTPNVSNFTSYHPTDYSIESIKTSADFPAAKLIFQSLSY